MSDKEEMMLIPVWVHVVAILVALVIVFIHSMYLLPTPQAFKNPQHPNYQLYRDRENDIELSGGRKQFVLHHMLRIVFALLVMAAAILVLYLSTK